MSEVGRTRRAWLAPALVIAAVVAGAPAGVANPRALTDSDAAAPARCRASGRLGRPRLRAEGPTGRPRPAPPHGDLRPGARLPRRAGPDRSPRSPPRVRACHRRRGRP